MAARPRWEPATARAESGRTRRGARPRRSREGCASFWTVGCYSKRMVFWRALRWRRGLLLFAGALLLRLGAIWKGSLDNDEIAEISWARLPAGAMLAQVESDRVHPPLDYFLRWGMLSLIHI